MKKKISKGKFSILNFASFFFLSFNLIIFMKIVCFIFATQVVNCLISLGLSKENRTREIDWSTVIWSEVWLIRRTYRLAVVLKSVDLMKSVWVTGERAWNLMNSTSSKIFSSTLFLVSSSPIWRFLCSPHQYSNQISYTLPHSNKHFFFSLHQYKEISTYSIISQQIRLDFGQIWQNLIWFLQTWHLIAIQ